MIPKRSLNPKEIIGLLSKLKSETPDYPADLLEARKAAFLKQAAILKIQGKGQGGQSGQQGGSSGSGGPGPALGGGPAAQSFLLQAIIGFSVVAAMLMAAFVYRDQIGEILKDRNVVVAVDDTGTPTDISTVTLSATASPVPTGSPTAGTPTATTPSLEIINGEDITIIDGTLFVDGTPVVGGTPIGTNTNPGLHLGQTPGTPAAPGHGNSGNQNKPDKPVRTDKPDNPNKPQKTDKPEKPK